jgi:hypothetical protein
MTEDQLDRLGRLADKAANFEAFPKLALPEATKVAALTEGMAELKAELRGLFREISGDDPWENQDV